jgi:hypothetical protein
MTTRYDRALRLLHNLQRGPVFSVIIPEDNAMTAEQASNHVRCWLESWIIDEVKFLVPELWEISKYGRR